MEISFSTSSWWIATLVIMVSTTIPVKLGANIFGALNKEMKHCAIAVVLGTIAAILLFKLLGGFLGLVSSYIAVSVIYWYILQISFAWSFVFTLVVLLLQFAILQVLGKLGMLAIS